MSQYDDYVQYICWTNMSSILIHFHCKLRTCNLLLGWTFWEKVVFNMWKCSLKYTEDPEGNIHPSNFNNKKVWNIYKFNNKNTRTTSHSASRCCLSEIECKSFWRSSVFSTSQSSNIPLVLIIFVKSYSYKGRICFCMIKQCSYCIA